MLVRSVLHQLDLWKELREQPWTLRPPVRSLSWLVCPAQCSLPRMKLSFSVKPTLIFGNATQLHMEHKSFNTPLIMHNTPANTHTYVHIHSDGCWDAHLGKQGHKHLRFWPREHSVWLKAVGCPLLTRLSLLGACTPWEFMAAVLKVMWRALRSCVKGLVTDVRQPNNLLAAASTNMQKVYMNHGCVAVWVFVCVCDMLYKCNTMLCC